MSLIQPSLIERIAEAAGVNNLSEEAPLALAPDVEQRLREIVQEACKFARHSKRTVLLPEDVAQALDLRNIEPPYCFASKDPTRFVKAAKFPEALVLNDKEVKVEELIEAPLPKPQMEVSLMMHWLAVEGRQPQTPENAMLDARPAVAAARNAKRQRPGVAAGGGGAELPPAQRPATGGASPGGQHVSFAGAPTAVAGALKPGTATEQPAAVQAAGARREGAAVGPKEASAAALQLKLPVAHLVSEELKLLYQRIAAVMRVDGHPGLSGVVVLEALGQQGSSPKPLALQEDSGPEDSGTGMSSAEVRPVLQALDRERGLQPLLPYIVAAADQGVKSNLKNLPRLSLLLHVVDALFCNPHLQLERHLPMLLPPILTCLLTKRMGLSASRYSSGSNHWAVREQAARLLRRVLARYGSRHANMRAQVCTTLSRTLLDTSKPLASHYGAAWGLLMLGPKVIGSMLLPCLPQYMASLASTLEPAAAQPEGAAASAAARQKQHDSLRVFAVLQVATGSCLYERMLSSVQDHLPEEASLLLSGTMRRPTASPASSAAGKQPGSPRARPPDSRSLKQAPAGSHLAAARTRGLLTQSMKALMGVAAQQHSGLASLVSAQPMLALPSAPRPAAVAPPATPSTLSVMAAAVLQKQRQQQQQQQQHVAEAAKGIGEGGGGGGGGEAAASAAAPPSAADDATASNGLPSAADCKGPEPGPCGPNGEQGRSAEGTADGEADAAAAAAERAQGNGPAAASQPVGEDGAANGGAGGEFGGSGNCPVEVCQPEDGQDGEETPAPDPCSQDTGPAAAMDKDGLEPQETASSPPLPDEGDDVAGVAPMESRGAEGDALPCTSPDAGAAAESGGVDMETNGDASEAGVAAAACPEEVADEQQGKDEMDVDKPVGEPAPVKPDSEAEGGGGAAPTQDAFVQTEAEEEDEGMTGAADADEVEAAAATPLQSVEEADGGEAEDGTPARQRWGVRRAGTSLPGNALVHAWSADSYIGDELDAAFELFGDAILPFVPTAPLGSLFL